MPIVNLYALLPSNIWEQFSFANCRADEQDILRPALEALGYTNIHFVTDEQDSFGPLSRIAVCTAPNGNVIHAVYG